MLFLLSPAKTLDYDTPVPLTVARKATDPLFTAQAKDLVAVLRKLTTAQVSELMALSDALAALNVGRYQAWQPQATPDNSKPAVLAFNGDVYDGLDARTLKLPDLTWAQEHLVILSGLYGALRPLDRLQPYRLEMGTALKTRRGKDLYAYWGDTVTHYLNERLKGVSKPIVVNLASQEYAKVALRPALQARVVDCQFEDWKGDRYKVISFFAKRARGLMARWAVQHRVKSVSQLQAFDADGYTFDPQVSSSDRLVFRRRISETT